MYFYILCDISTSIPLCFRNCLLWREMTDSTLNKIFRRIKEQIKQSNVRVIRPTFLFFLIHHICHLPLYYLVDANYSSVNNWKRTILISFCTQNKDNRETFSKIWKYDQESFIVFIKILRWLPKIDSIYCTPDFLNKFLCEFWSTISIRLIKEDET